MELKNKTVLITGGATGIGRAIALRLAREGANIAINYSKSRAEAEETLKDVQDLGVKGMLCQCDVSRNLEVVEMVNQVKETLGRIDILINNAGTTVFVPLEELDQLQEEHWDRTLAVNVKGIFFVSRACADELRKNRGAIVNITSIAGFNGAGSSIAYAASKAAGNSLTRSFAKVLAPEVRVNSIAPGIVNTRWVGGQEDHIKRYSDGTPLGRVADPEDIADMVWAVISGGDFVTGQTIIVDGGWMMA